MSSLTLPVLEVANVDFVTPALLTGGDLHHDPPVPSTSSPSWSKPG